MIIIFPLDDILFELFDISDPTDHSMILEGVKKYYKDTGIDPNVRIESEHLVVELPEKQIAGFEKDFDDAWKDCEQGRFNVAKPKLQKLAVRFPQHPLIRSVLGQVHFELQEYDEAMDHFIETLRWDPTNLRALTMMGNLWARVKREPETAATYYKEVLRHHPEDRLAARNLGAVLVEQDQCEEAVILLSGLLRDVPDDPHVHFILAQAKQKLGLPHEAFDHAISTVKNAEGPLHFGALELAMQLASEARNERKGVVIVHDVKEQLQKLAGKPVHLTQDNGIKTAAKLEVAENHGRDRHVVRFVPGHPAEEHLQLHELYHLRYILEARNAGGNMRFTSHAGLYRSFRRKHDDAVKKLIRDGVSADSAENYLEALYNGFLLQIYNAPIDLFIEYDMHQEYPDMRPYQLLSLSRMLNDAITACTDPKVTSTAPAQVVSVSKVYNLTQALLLKEIYGWDRIKELKATPKELQQADVFYTEFQEYRKDREPAEEYEVVQNWAKDLQVDGYFRLESETEVAPANDPLEQQIGSIEEDPIGNYEQDPEKVREMRDFQERQKEIGLNMAVVMFMVDAMRYFKSKSPADIRKAAFEIAMVGSQGIHPEKQGYKLASVPGKTFSGYHLLAYYYVSFKLVLPEMLADLQLPFDKEYDMAATLEKTGQ